MPCSEESPSRCGLYKCQYRHCERSEAIQSGVPRRCARRNDELGVGLGRLVGKPDLADLALLGGGELGRVLALDQLDRTAGLLDRLAGALRHAGDLERQLGLQLALAEEADTVP